MYKLTLHTTQTAVDDLASVLWEYGAVGVQIEDHATLADLAGTYDYIDASLQMQVIDQAIVHGFFEGDCTALLDDIYNSCAFVEIDRKRTVVHKVLDEDWVQAYKQFFVDVDYGAVVVVPEWSTQVYHKLTVRLHLASAFGTGAHESTTLCIQGLQEYMQKGMRVADVGCGSGILGLVALLLGAAHVQYTDIDDQAIGATYANLALNNIDSARYNVTQCSLLDGVSGQYDIIVANLTADILIQLAAQLPQHKAQHTVLILSGIINARAKEVADAYKDIGTITTRTMGEWTSVICDFIQTK
jgi:ribosomal protein L11 methyltransferase